MRRSISLLFGLALAGIFGAGCLEDIKDDCKTDADCGPGGECVDEGVRFCVGPEGGSGGAGSGGNAGDGGDGGGGSGGVGGSGGSGGSGGAEFEPLDLPVVIMADSPLAAFLKKWPRDVRKLDVRITVGDAEPVSHTLNDAPVGGFPLLEGGSEAYRFVVPIEFEVGTTPEIEVQVDALALNLSGDLLPFAVGAKSTTASHFVELLEEPGLAVPVTVSGHSAFDYDADSVVDWDDCEPEDGTIHPGAVDFCNGVDNDCNPRDACVVMLPEGQHTLDLACSGGKCVAAVDGVGETQAASEEGALVIADASFAGSPAFLPIPDPRGVAVWQSNVLVYDPTTSKALMGQLDGPSTELTATIVPSGTLFGPWAVSPHGNMAFGPYLNSRSVEFLNPHDGLSSAQPVVSCGTGICSRVDLSVLHEASIPLVSGARPRQVEIRHMDGEGNAQLYVLFSGDKRLGIASIRPDGVLVSSTSGLLTLASSTVSKRLALNPTSSVLYVSAGERDDASVISLVTGNIYDAHGQPIVTPLPIDTCPGALAAHGSTLWIADECNGRLLKLDLDAAGLPLGDEGTYVDLGDRCSIPTHLALSDATGSDPALFVACQGQNNLVVLGRD